MGDKSRVEYAERSVHSLWPVTMFTDYRWKDAPQMRWERRSSSDVTDGKGIAKMGRRIRAIDAKTGKPINIDADAIKQGHIQHPSLPDALLLRIRAIHERIRDAYDVTLEQFEIAFMRDADPEGEVSVWERIVVGFERASSAVPELDRKAVLRTVIGYSMDALTDAERANPDVRRIIEIAEGK